ncbi:PASTA domain-containing protein [Flavobacteriaceae bacterium]|nr:PASTA domain-containing protein [Flavobacteriaceae bacterium]
MKFFKFLVSKALWLNVLLGLVITTLLIYGVIKGLHIFTNQEQRINVPSLEGLTVDEVAIVLNELKLDYKVLDSGSYNPDLPKESVLEQDPKVGSVVKEKRKIYLTINPNGYTSTEVPEFYGKTKKEIEQIIVNSGFVIGMYEEIDDIGTVVRELKFQNEKLTAGDLLPKMTAIDIVIGNGQLK